MIYILFIIIFSPLFLYADDNTGAFIGVWGAILVAFITGIFGYLTKKTDSKIDYLINDSKDAKEDRKSLREKLEIVETKVDNISYDQIERFNFFVLLENIDHHTYNIVRHEKQLADWIKVKNKFYDQFVESLDIKLSSTEKIDIEDVIGHAKDMSSRAQLKGHELLGKKFVDFFYAIEHEQEVDKFVQYVESLLIRGDSNFVKRQQFRNKALKFKEDFNSSIVSYYMSNFSHVDLGGTR